MKGLLLKDFFVLKNSLNFYIALILLFTLLPSYYFQIFAITYVSMLPQMFLNYDEHSRWNELAAMMPYSPRDLVLSKYVLSWLLCGGLSLLVLVVGAVERLFALQVTPPTGVLIAFSAALILIALSIPFLLRFGAAKGRQILVLMVVIVACGGASVLSGVLENPALSIPSLPLLLFPVSAILLSAISVFISIAICRKRR